MTFLGRTRLTRSLQEWAMVQAKKRMEARGDLPKYIPSAEHIAKP
jgi:hypothetical protein